MAASVNVFASINQGILDITPWFNWVSDYEIKQQQQKTDSKIVTLVDIYFVFFCLTQTFLPFSSYKALISYSSSVDE